MAGSIPMCNESSVSARASLTLLQLRHMLADKEGMGHKVVVQHCFNNMTR